jgi:hypothetical protein
MIISLLDSGDKVCATGRQLVDEGAAGGAQPLRNATERSVILEVPACDALVKM